MRKNFIAMPTVLKLLTAVGFGVLLMVLSTMRPHSMVRVFDRSVTASEWWASGAGPFMLIVAGLFCASAVMMLNRFKHARLAYIVALIALSISAPFVAGVTRVGETAVNPGIIPNLLLTLAIALYLYLSKGARQYFDSGAG
jgi:hypothetical protein